MSAPRSMDGIYRRPKRLPTPPPPPKPTPSAPKKSVRPRRHLGQQLVRGFTWSLVLTGMYLVVAPYTPSVYFFFRPPQPIKATTVLQNVPPPSASAAPAAVPYFGKNVLTIEKIGVQSEILEGVNEEALDRGLWRRPNTSTPELGGNTVIAAHRYKYTTGANTFYNLDKLQAGDIITAVWKGKTYRYEVYLTRTVSAAETWVEANTKEAIMTLYTCTPLWTSTNRLVVQAKLLN